MKEVTIFEIIFPYVYEGLDKITGNAIFHDTLWNNYVEQPRLMEFQGQKLWDGEDFLMYEQGGLNPNHPNPDMRIIPAVQKRIKPGMRLIFAKQRQFLRLLDHFDKLSFGGAGGGGKSRILAMSHLWKHIRWKKRGVTDAKSAMFCETNPDLYHRQISMIRRWFPDELFSYHEVKKELTWRKKWGSGQMLYLSSEDTARLRSIEFGHVTVDEASRNPYRIVGEISSRVRDPRVNDKSFGLATNPGGIGTAWYKRDLVDEATRIKPIWDDVFKIQTKGSFHIQCLPTENPLLGPAYYAGVNQEAPHIRDQILYGKWDAHSGTYFPHLNPYIHRIPDFKIPDNVIKWRGIDVGTYHPFVCVWIAFFPPDKDFPFGRLIQYRELSIKEKIPSEFKKKVLAAEKDDKNIMGTILSPDAFRDKRTYVDDHSIAEMFDDKNVHGASFNCERAYDDRIPGWRLCSEYFNYDAVEVSSGSKWYDIRVQPRLQFFESCKLTYEAFTNLIHDKNNPEDVQKTMKSDYGPGQGDDEPDAVRYVVFTLMSEQRSMREPNEFDPQSYDRRFQEADPDYSPYARF